jgi:hypothetical protein
MLVLMAAEKECDWWLSFMGYFMMPSVARLYSIKQ